MITASDVDDNAVMDIVSSYFGIGSDQPTQNASYGASPTKRKRRTKCEIGRIRDQLYNIVARNRPMTVRQVFYQAVVGGIVEKTEGEYKTTVCRLLSEMRRDGELPYTWIADNTRWMRKPTTYSSLREMLTLTKETYRRHLWSNQDAYVEVWMEKDALAGVVLEETAPWDVPLMVSRGFSSLSFLYSAGETIREMDKPTYLYYLGDHDPSGHCIREKIEEDLRGFAPNAEIHFEAVAVTPEQITEFNLPTRPTKRTDSRSKNFKGESVEVDAILPETLRAIVRRSIQQHIDRRELEQLQITEEAERQTLERIVDRLEVQ